jgi:hypothetical protein
MKYIIQTSVWLLLNRGMKGPFIQITKAKLFVTESLTGTFPMESSTGEKTAKVNLSFGTQENIYCYMKSNS